MILRVGLTGGIGSGKSTVARMLVTMGCSVIDSDRLVAELYEPGEAGWRAVREQFGEQVLMADGAIDRSRLSAAALSTPEGAARLNALIHPLVIERQARWIEELSADGEDHIAIIEATLLLESGGRQRCDRVIVVTAPQEIRIERAVRRGLPEEEVRRRISRQMSDDDRVLEADYVIENDRSLPELEAGVRALYESLRADLHDKKQNARVT